MALSGRSTAASGTLIGLTMLATVSAAAPVSVAPDGAADDPVIRADEPPAAQTDAPSPPDLPIEPSVAAPAALVLDGDLQTATLDCGGRDVLVHGDGGHYLLLHGCRSVSVQGRGNHIEAELQPGARVAIGGSDVLLNYVVVPDGPPPVVSVTATNSHATAVPRLGSAGLSRGKTAR